MTARMRENDLPLKPLPPPPPVLFKITVYIEKQDITVIRIIKVRAFFLLFLALQKC